MDADVNQQQQLLSNSSVNLNDATITEETPLTDSQPYEAEGIQSAIPDILDWNTGMISEICREGDLPSLRLFIEYSQQTTSCAQHAAEIADRLDVDTGLSPLHHAARYQQLDICLALLSNIEFKLGVNIKDAYHRTPIHSAFRSSNTANTTNSNPEKQFNIEADLGNKIQDVELWKEEYTNQILSSDHPLIYLFAKAKGDINACDKYLLTPLHYAVARNSLSGVKQLIALKADIEAQDRQNIRPLHLACKEGYLSIVEYLIEQGAKLDASDGDRWTPLHYACAKGHLDIIQLFQSLDRMNFQTSIQRKTNTNASCLHLAVQHGNINTVKYILTEINRDAVKILVNEQVESFGTPLHIAAKFCDPPMLNLLYQHGADPFILNSLDQTALHVASASNRLSIVQELFSLTQQSLLEIKDSDGQTALSVTTNLDIVKELITHGANIASLNHDHMNVLMIAVLKGQISIVEHLLLIINDQLTVVLDQVTKGSHRSLFLLAVQTGSIDMCSTLLTHPNVRWTTLDKQRMNAFHIAARHNHHELIEFLGEQLRKTDRFVSLKSRSYSVPVATTDSDLINISQSSPMLRLYIDAQTEDGQTPLHLAAERGHALSVAVLLKFGVDVLLPNYVGQLALHVAIQNGYCQCVDLLINGSLRNMADFQSALLRRQSPLITACQNGFADIVRLLLARQIGIDHDYSKEKENPLEIAIKYRHIETIHVLLEHPYTEHWLMAVRNTKNHLHQTPLRDMIRHIPECAEHAFDKLIMKTDETDSDGNTLERVTYVYKHIDDYFTEKDELYTTSGHQLYRNHPFIIALDAEHHSLLEHHPLVQQLIQRKWQIYRPLFYLARALSLLLLLVLTFFVLIVPAPNSKSTTNRPSPLMQKFVLPIQWTIVILSGINLFKIILEIILYRGLRVPFAQLFSLISFLTSIIAFIPYENEKGMIKWQWQLAAFSTLFQWFNAAFILRSVPFIGNVVVMFQSILFNFAPLTFIIVPLLIAFTIGAQMMFFNHSSFLTILIAMHKLSAMVIGEFDYETLFFSKPTFKAAAFIFIPFIVIMTILFMNLLLGITVGDIGSCMDNARAKANAYRIRELIYIESTLPFVAWLKFNVVGSEFRDIAANDATSNTKNEDDDHSESLPKSQHLAELGKLLDILNMLCVQSKQVMQREIGYETLLKQLLAARKAHSSKESSTEGLNTSR